MADNFGLKIGLEGEKQFKSQIAEITQTFKVLGSEMKLVESQFSSQDKSQEALTARNEVLNKSIEAQKEKIETLKSALNNASESFGETDKRTKNWQVQLNNAQAELIKMQKELDSNNASLNDAGKEFDDAEKKVDEFGDEVEDAGKQADDSSSKFSGLGSVCKAVGATMTAAFAAVSAAAISAGKALVNMAKEGASYADDILTQSTVTGIATDKLQEYKYAAELVDVSLETLTGSMAKQIKSMKSATDGSKNYVEAYEKLGVAILDADGNMRDSDTVYWELIDALSNLENETERDAYAMTLLGRSAQDLNPLITAGADRMAELAEQAHESGYVLSGELLESYGAFDDQLQYLNNSCTAAKNALGSVLLPILTELATDGVSLISQFTNGIKNANGDVSKIGEVFTSILKIMLDSAIKSIPRLIDIVSSIVDSMGNAIVDNMDTLIESAGKIIGLIVGNLTKGFPKLAKSTTQILMTLVKGIISNLPQIVSAAVEVIVALGNGLIEALPELIPMITLVIVEICQNLLDNLPMLLDVALQLILGLAEGIIQAIPVLIEALPKIINSLVNFLLNAVPQIIAAGITLLTSLVHALPEIIGAIVAVIPQIINGVITAVLGAIPELINAGVQLFISLIDNLPLIISTIIQCIPDIISSICNALIDNLDEVIEAGILLFTAIVSNMPAIIEGIVKNIPEIIKSIVSAFGNIGSKMIDVGKNMVKGLWEGIQTLKDWLWDKVSDWCSNLWNGILDFFGIHSPSRKLKWVGNMLVEGLAGGIDEDDSADKAVQELSNNINDIVNGITANPKIKIETNVDDSVGSLNKAIQNLVLDTSAVSRDFNIGAPYQIESSQQPIQVSVPLYLDGELITKSTSKFQSINNASLKRAMGV